MNTISKWVLVFIFTLLYAVTSFAAPQIVASIKPIHSLVSNLTEGITTPILLMQNATSPHHYAIRPSEMKLLARADLLLLVGEGLENNLVRVAKTLPTHVTVMELLKTPDLEPIPYRKSKKADSATYDPHIWLDPLRMITVAKNIAKRLSEIDPPHQEKYQSNAKILEEKLKELHKRLVTELKPIQNKPFLTFHDAYAYLVERYHLKNADFVSQHPEQPTSAKRLKDLRKLVVQGQFACIFQEAEFPLKTMTLLTENTKIKIAMLDPIGNHLPEGATQYFKMMAELANPISNCLKEAQ